VYRYRYRYRYTERGWSIKLSTYEQALVSLKIKETIDAEAC